MIEGERQIGYGTDGNGVVNHHRLFLHGADAENGYLRLIDDRRSENTAEASEIRDGECPTLYFIRLQLARTRASGEIDDGTLQTQHVLLVGIANHRHDQSILQRHRDPDVDFVVVDDVRTFDGGVQNWIFVNGLDSGCDHERQIGKRISIALLELRFV